MSAPQEKSVDGVNVFLDSYYVHDTYSGCYEGAPSVDDSLKHAKLQLERIWGMHRPILVVQPTVKEGGREPLLPNRCMMAWLNSYTSPPNQDFCGSHLFVIWFDDEDAQSPLLMALKHVNDAGGWWANAKGWDV